MTSNLEKFPFLPFNNLGILSMDSKDDFKIFLDYLGLTLDRMGIVGLSSKKINKLRMQSNEIQPVAEFNTFLFSVPLKTHRLQDVSLFFIDLGFKFSTNISESDTGIGKTEFVAFKLTPFFPGDKAFFSGYSLDLRPKIKKDLGNLEVAAEIVGHYSQYVLNQLESLWFSDQEIELLVGTGDYAANLRVPPRRVFDAFYSFQTILESEYSKTKVRMGNISKASWSIYNPYQRRKVEVCTGPACELLPFVEKHKNRLGNLRFELAPLGVFNKMFEYKMLY